MKIADVLRLFALAGLWGGSFIFMRIAAPVLGPVWLIEIRILLAGLMMLPLLHRLKLWGHLKGYLLPFFVLGAINFAFPFVLFAFASLYLPAGFNSILNSTTPLFSTFIVWIWFQEPFTLRKIVGFVLGFAGVIILVGLRHYELTPSFVAAVIAGLGAAILYAFAAPYAMRELAGIPSVANAACAQLAGAIILLPLLPFTVPKTLPNFEVTLAAIALAIFSTALAYLLYFQLLRNIGSTQTLAVTYLVPLFAILWGWFFLGEGVTDSMVVGGGFILFGVAIALSPRVSAS